MKTKEYFTVDKTMWGLGAWTDEPDKIQYPDPDTGLPCLIVRNALGSLCGYVGVPEGHPCFGKNYDTEGTFGIEVHGGLTYAGPCDPSGDEAARICHTPAKGEPDHVWWLGYDCGHAWDISPSMESHGFMSADDCTYKDVPFVKKNNALLAQQLKAMVTGKLLA